ncbi:alpha/beta hydrolase [Nonlabens ulvanivorans]|uniref:alpha/beta hydrolase n=1 Tax=Nonlabens ulvanivorans TaxID=906888 RepID=UPI0037C53B84
MKTFTDLSLKHVIRPANKENAPLLLLLHGYGSNEEDLFSFAPEISQDFFIVSARAPYNMVPQGAAWYAINFDATGGKFSDVNQAKESMALLLKFIEELKTHYPISKDKINILGFSQGAILSYGLSLSHPALFNKVVCMSGYLNEEIIEQPEDLESRFRESENQPSYFISHGTVDQVVPYAWAKLAPDFLKKLNIDHVFKDYPIGHGVARDNFYDMKEWLERDL